MRRLCLWLAFWTLPAAVHAEEAKEPPVLVLDPGGHTAPVRKVLFRPPHGKELITVSEDRTIRVWDVDTGQTLRVLRVPLGRGNQGRLFAAAVSPDGRNLAVAGSGYRSGRKRFIPIYVINLASGQMARVLEGHTDSIVALTFAPGGQRLASGSLDRTARLWDLKTGKALHLLEGHRGPVSDVAFSPNGRRLATAAHDHSARLWSAASGKVESVLNHAQAAIRDERGWVTGIAWSRDSKTVASCTRGHTLWLWNADGKLRRRFTGPAGSNPHYTLYTSLTFHREGRLLLTWGDNRGDRTRYNQGYASLVEVSTGKEQVRFPRLAPRQPPVHTGIVLQGALSPDGKRAATTGGEHYETYIWRTADARPLQRLAARSEGTNGAGWSPDGSTVAWGKKEETYDYKGPVGAAGYVRHTFNLKTLRRGWGGNLSKYLGAHRRLGALSLHTPTPNFSQTVGYRNPVPVVLVREKNKTIATLRPPHPAHCFTLLRGGRAVVGTDHELIVYDARTGKEIRRLVGHNGPVWNVATSPGGRYLLSASDDQTLRIWSPGLEVPLLSLFFADEEWIAWTPAGYYAASFNGQRLMGWQVNNGLKRMASFYSAAQLRKQLYQPNLIGWRFQKLLQQPGQLEVLLAVAGIQSASSTFPPVADPLWPKRGPPNDVARILPPKVWITRPELSSGLELEQAELMIEATAEKMGTEPVMRMELWLDDRPYAGAKAVVTTFQAGEEEGQLKASWKVVVPPGKHRFQVKASNKAQSNALSANILEVTFKGNGKPAAKPNLYVLAVGVNNYKNAGIPRLSWAVKDARDLIAAFQKKSGPPIFGAVKTRLVHDAKATRQGILEGLAWLKKESMEQDVAVLFFSGHGEMDQEKFYLLSSDADLNRLDRTAVSGDKIKKLLRGLRCRRVILMLDACHSGGIGSPAAIFDQSLDFKEESGVMVMCAAGRDERANEHRNIQHGFFAKGIIDALNDKATDFDQDGTIEPLELFLSVKRRVKKLCDDLQPQFRQEPRMGVLAYRAYALARP